MTATVSTPSATTPHGSAATLFAPIQREFDRFFDQLQSNWANLTDGVSARMDVRDTADAVEITMETPGVASQDLQISLEDNILTIAGEKRTKTDAKDEAYRLSERSYGAFRRSLTLPPSIDPSKITASLDQGVLKIVAPRTEPARPRTIAIQSQN